MSSTTKNGLYILFTGVVIGAIGILFANGNLEAFTAYFCCFPWAIAMILGGTFLSLAGLGTND